MYRKSRGGHDYYTCTGQGAARKSCGTSVIPCEKLDAQIHLVMSQLQQPHYDLEWIPGDSKAQQLADVNEKIAAAAKEGRYDLIPELSAQAAVISAKRVRKARVVRHKSGKTVGQHWQTLDAAGQHDELLNWEVIAYPDRAEIKSPWQRVPDDFDPAA